MNPPPCPHCGQPTTLPITNARETGAMLTRRCTFIADSDFCVVCTHCKLHMHLPGRRP